MKGTYLMLVTIYTYVFLATGIEKPKQCFHFTWPGSRSGSDFTCTEHNNTATPCIDNYFISREKPNLVDLWNDTDERKKLVDNYIEEMGPDNVCVRFTYVYNSAVVNVSYFHGKVTEDQVTPITTGCYVQYTEGYAIEVCACIPEDDDMPCNSTIRNTHSALIIFAVAAVSLFMYKIFDIP